MVNQLRKLFHTSGMRCCAHICVSKPLRALTETESYIGFLILSNYFGNSKYLLVLEDDVTHLCELVQCDAADSSVATAAKLDWHCRFGTPPVWVSDNGNHFKVIKKAEKSTNFTLAYYPVINGSAEHGNRDILQVFRAMILEYKVSTKDGAYRVPLVQASLNHSALPSLGNRAPVELFTGLQFPLPQAEFYDPGIRKLVMLPVNSAAISKHLGLLRTSLCAMPKPIADQRL
ncbi:Hypothetical protein PHPALM_9057 [Phytophthora palmivora]|uniref:Integrase catalytic domain-containing protein n=1 Tax=Phytophthora palmivora TaxID=4796 RepID=A0A2P4Y8A4_9STRA|nr:Hypothetical protein PHPALM_9057 [Phytophthora palmivora]